MRGDQPSPIERVSESALLAEIDFGRHGRSQDDILGGWAEQESGHRWSVGQQSSVRLPVPPLGPDCVVVVDINPWTDARHLPTQTVMLSIDDRLIATFQIGDHRVLAFAIPPHAGTKVEPILTFAHLSSRGERPPTGLDHVGRPLGLMVTSIRVFRLPASGNPLSRPGLHGTIADGGLPTNVRKLTGLSPAQLAFNAESLGHNCEFGLVQRYFEAEPLGLLRFASVVTHKLVDGLMARFDGVGAPETTRIYVSDPPQSEYRVHEQLYYSWYNLGKTPSQITQAAMHREQCRRLSFLQRKFVEDVRASEKMFVLTRPEVLTEAEALSVFCALQVEAPNTLLWTVHGDVARAGQVDRLRPGFLRGHLGAVDDRQYASMEAWLSVLANAHALREAARSGRYDP